MSDVPSSSTFPTASLRSADDHRVATERVRSGVGWIVLHHFRKCGGTSLRMALLDALCDLTGAAVEEGVERPQVWSIGASRLYSQEWGALAPAAFQEEPPALLVTSLRHPVERWVSEFEYAGPGADPSLDGRDLLDAWHGWLSSGAESRGAGGVKRGRYLDHFFIRSLIGAPPGGIYRSIREVPYHGDSTIFGGGAPLHAGKIGAPELELALGVLSSFDLVLGTETLSEPRTIGALSSLLGVGVSMGHQRRSPTRRDVPGEILERLAEENRWDVQLFESVRRHLPAAYDDRLGRLVPAEPEV